MMLVPWKFSSSSQTMIKIRKQHTYTFNIESDIGWVIIDSFSVTAEFNVTNTKPNNAEQH